MRSQPVPERWPMHAQRRRHGRRPPPPPALHLHLRGGESRGRATGGVAANTFDAYKPKTPNLDKRPPMTPNFEPFGRCVFFC